MNTTTKANIPASPKKTRRPASLDKRKAHAGWFFVLPFVIGFVLIYIIPLLYLIYHSFLK